MQKERNDYDEEEEEIDCLIEKIIRGKTEVDDEREKREYDEAVEKVLDITSREDNDSIIKRIKKHQRFSSLVKKSIENAKIAEIVANLCDGVAKIKKRRRFDIDGVKVDVDFVDYSVGGLGGFEIWPACVPMCECLAASSVIYGMFNGVDVGEKNTVLELGAGVGLLGLFLLKRFPNRIQKIVATDFVPAILDVLVSNAKLNLLEETYFVKRMLWEEAANLESFVVGDGSVSFAVDEKWERESLRKDDEKFDFIVGSDVAYDERIIVPLVAVIDIFLKERTGIAFISLMDRYGNEVMPKSFEDEVSKYSQTLLFQRVVQKGSFYLYKIIKRNVEM